MRREVCIIYPRVQIGTSTRWGEFGGGGLTFFISELETTPSLAPRTPAYCIERCSPGMRLLYVVQAAHNGMIKGRTSSPTHAYVPSHCANFKSRQWGKGKYCSSLACRFPRSVPCVFRVMLLFAERVCLPVERRKRVPACAGTLCSYCVRWVTLLGG